MAINSVPLASWTKYISASLFTWLIANHSIIEKCGSKYLNKKDQLRAQEAERPGINELKTGIMFEKTRANTAFIIRSVTMICLEEIVQHFSHNSKNWKKSRFLLLTKKLTVIHLQAKMFRHLLRNLHKNCTCSPNL